MGLTILGAAVILAANNTPYVVQYEERTFKSCQDAAYYYQNLPAGEAASFSHNLGYHATIIGTVHPKRIMVRLDVRDAIIRLPDWKWPGSGRSAFERFQSELRQHEIGHYAIAERFVSRLRFISIGRSQPAASAMRAVRSFVVKINKKLKAQQQAYDTATDHGVLQHNAVFFNLRPTPDVSFSCN